MHSLHSYFLRPGDPHEEIRYAVDRIRDGRSFTTRRVVAWQQRKGEDVAIFALTADFHAGEQAVAEHSPADARRARPGDAARHGGDRRPARRARRRWMGAMGRAVEQRFLEDPFAAPPEVAAGHADPRPGCGSPASCPTTRRCTPRR